MKNAPLPQLALALGLAAVYACGTQAPDPGATQAAALAAGAAYDTLDDLGALDDPDAPGTRDAFRGTSVEALERAAKAHRTARGATAEAHRRSLHAAELTDRFGLALADAIEARDDLEAAVADTLEARLILQEAAFSQAEVALLAAEDEAARRLGFANAEALGRAYDDASRRFLDRPPLRNGARTERYDGLSLPAMLNEETERERLEVRAHSRALSELQKAYRTTHTQDEYRKLLDRMYPGRRQHALAELEAIDAGERNVGTAEVSRNQRERRRLFPGPTEAALNAARDSIEYAGVTRENAAAKVAVAEELRRQAMTAYRAAADAWRAALLSN